MTLVVNLFAGPGAGKSTTRAGVFAKLKMAGKNVEEATEFAKILTWEARHMAFTCQPYIFGKQLYALHRLAGQVDAVITDSPLLLSNIYCPLEEPASFRQLVMDKFNAYNNLNFFVKRNKPYNPKGRNQTFEEAKEIDNVVWNYLIAKDIPFIEVVGNEYAVDKIYTEVMYRFENTR